VLLRTGVGVVNFEQSLSEAEFAPRQNVVKLLSLVVLPKLARGPPVGKADRSGSGETCRTCTQVEVELIPFFLVGKFIIDISNIKARIRIWPPIEIEDCTDALTHDLVIEEAHRGWHKLTITDRCPANRSGIVAVEKAL